MEHLPLEQRKLASGGALKIPALNKKFTPDWKWVPFYMPTLSCSEDELGHWVESMGILSEDLRWLLSLPHHVFWSVAVYSTPLSKEVLSSFLKKAPRTYDPSYEDYKQHPFIWSVYTDLHALFFRVYMRLATYKESKEDYIGVEFWAKLLHEHNLLRLPSLLSLGTIYGSPPLLGKMIGNVIEHQPKVMQEFEAQVPIFLQKFSSLTQQTETLLRSYSSNSKGVGDSLRDILLFTIDSLNVHLKFCQLYPRAAEKLVRHPHFLSKLASGYDSNARVWGKAAALIPQLKEIVKAARVASLRLFRDVLASPTLLSVESANDRRLDEFFDYFCGVIDEKVLIHDYEKCWPFKEDMKQLLSKGIFVDETRIEYIANAISASFHSCGKEYAVEKIVVDPLYDPNFDRQLLGACSLELSGVELESLVSQVNDLFPDLPTPYIEATLKHYGYNTETTIHALLEGSVPSRLEKYKSVEYSQQQIVKVKEEEETNEPPERLLPAKDKRGIQETRLDEETKEATKAQLNRMLTQQQEREQEYDSSSRYLDSNLLPSFDYAVNYDDEYDDTYDDVGAGMTEPDVMPLNVRRTFNKEPEEDVVEEEEGPRGGGRNNMEAFCEDPAIVRARLEQRRKDQQQKRHGPTPQHHQPQQQSQGTNSSSSCSGNNNSRDVVGKAKGQGQDKDVVYNRRKKNENKGGNFKKRSDFKRKEF